MKDPREGRTEARENGNVLATGLSRNNHISIPDQEDGSIQDFRKPTQRFRFQLDMRKSH